MIAVRTVGEVAQSNPHIVVDRTGDRQGDRDTEDRMRHGQRVDISVLKKKQAGSETPDQGHWRQDGVGQVRNRKQRCCQKACQLSIGQHAEQPQQNEIQKNQLLQKRPDRVGPVALEDHYGTARQVQGVQSPGKQGGSSRKHQGYAYHPD